MGSHHIVDHVGQKTEMLVAVIVRLVCYSLLVWQISICIKNYMNSGTSVKILTSKDSKMYFPAISLCPQPSYDPRRMASLGLQMEGMTYDQLHEEMLDLDFLPDNVTIEDMVNTAFWSLNYVVDDIYIENANGTRIQTFELESTLKIEILPWGPCYAFQAPPVVPGSVLVIIPHDEMTECSWWERGQLHVYLPGRHSCWDVITHCNRSCEWADFVARDFANSIILHDTSEAYLTRYVTPLNLWPGDFLLKPYQTLLLEGSDGLTAHECFFFCYKFYLEKKSGERLNCEIPLNLSSAVTAKHMCKPRIYSERPGYNKYYETVESCLNICEIKKQQNNWSTKDSIYGRENKFSVRLETAVVFEEFEIYPLSLMLAGIGGNLGLFVGISFYSQWNAGNDFLTSFFKSIRGHCAAFSHKWSFKLNPICPKKSIFLKKHLRRNACNSITSAHWRSLGYYSMLLILMWFTTLHSCVAVQNLIKQSSTLGMQLECAKSDDISKKNTTQTFLKRLVMTQIAGRALGCRLDTSSVHQMCLTECVLVALAAERASFLPYLHYEDLPYCKDDSRSQYYMYLLQSDIQVFLPDNMLQKCADNCVSLNLSNFTEITDSNDSCLKFSFTVNPQGKAEIIFYNVGSIISLYFGVSLMNLVEYLGERRLRICLNSNFKFKLVVLTLKTMVFVLGLLLCLTRISDYLFHSKIVTQISSWPINSDMVPILTFCRIPNLSVNTIFEQMNITADEYWNLSPPLQRGLLFKALKYAPDILHNLWNTTTNSMIKELKLEKHNPVCPSWDAFIAYGVCCSVGHSIEKNSRGYIRYSLSTDYDFPELSSITFLILHYQDTLPLLTDYLYASRQLFEYDLEVDVKSVTKYISKDEKIELHGHCMQRCLQGTMKNKSLERLSPTNFTLHTLYPSLSKGEKVLDMLLRWDQYSESSHPRRYMNKYVSSCRVYCSNSQRTFMRVSERQGSRPVKFLSGNHMYSWVLDNMNLYYVIGVYMKDRFYEVVEDHDNLSVDCLASDLGGLIGITFGSSLMSLFLTSVEYIFSLRRNRLMLRE